MMKTVRRSEAMSLEIRDMITPGHDKAFTVGALKPKIVLTFYVYNIIPLDSNHTHTAGSDT